MPIKVHVLARVVQVEQSLLEQRLHVKDQATGDKNRRMIQYIPIVEES